MLLTITVLVAFTPAADALRCLSEFSDVKFEKNVPAEHKQKLKSMAKSVEETMFGDQQIDSPLLMTAKDCATVDQCTQSVMTEESLDLTCKEIECCDGEMCNGAAVPHRNGATVSRHFSSKATGLIFTILVTIFKEEKRRMEYTKIICQ
uniref:Activin_recp domain-containing protein n=1 Tax=Globodera pallida TaxID=36090 RepID=A0A183CNV2_GLOPA